MDNSRAFIDYDQWKTSEPDDPWEDESPEGAARNELELWRLLDYYHVNSLQEAQTALKYVVYKYTDCGAWVAFEMDQVLIGSIVEGVDECTPTVTLPWPITVDQWETAIEQVETWAREIWNNTHGCPYCTGLDPRDGDVLSVWEPGDTAVNPNCPHCGGEGVVI